MELKDQIITAISYYKSPFKQQTIREAKRLKGQIGLELGGPSSVFSRKSFFPVYLYAKSVDGVNFSNQTVWEGQLTEGDTYNYLSSHGLGHQYIDEAGILSTVPDNKYDFLLSSHSLEHMANPIKALKRWHAVLKPRGTLCLILPDKRFTFDHNRPYTTFEHLLQDEAQDVDENDTTHFEEVIRLHDLSKDIDQDKVQFEQRTRDNSVQRCVHHHVFSPELIEQLLNYCGFEVTISKTFKPFHLFTLARKKD